MPLASGIDNASTDHVFQTSFADTLAPVRNQQRELYNEVADIISDPELPVPFSGQEKQMAAAVAAKQSSSNKIGDYLKSRFNKDNWFGSLIIPATFYTYLETFQAAMTHKVNGVPKVDSFRAVGALIFMGEKTWSFFSFRGGIFPQGKNISERAANALKHPQISSTQFEWLILLPARLFSIIAAASAGLKAYGIGLKQGEIPYAQEKIRLYLAGVQTFSTFLTGLGHFRKRGNIAQQLPEKTADNGKHGILDVIRKIWKYDKVLFVGSVVSTLMPALEGLEGWIKSSRSHTEAVHLIKAGAISTVIGASYTAYTFQRIEKSNYHKSVEKPEEEQGYGNTSFVQRIGKPQPSLARVC